MVDVAFRGNNDETKRLIRDFLRQLSGKSPDQFGLAKSVFFSIGLAALSDIHADFVVKARGGTGEDGVTWPKLSKKYLAYGRRFGKGEQAALKAAAGLGKGNRLGVGGKGGLLTKQQQERWNKLYRSNVARLAARMSIVEAKKVAAGMAWNKIKEEGAKTKLEVYGNRDVEILRDTGVLLNSLGPGYLDSTGYTKPSGEGGEQQVFKALSDGVIIGSSVPYAATHNYGDAKRGIPARPFLPKVVPQVWYDRWLAVARSTIQEALSTTLERGAA